VTEQARALAFVHASVVLWGFTAILGKLISLPAAALVWWRMLLVAGMLAVLPRVWRGLAAMPLRLMLTLAAIGIVVALHWLTFYASIKLANASVAATCMALGAVFAALIEPFWVGRRFRWPDLATGVAAVPGVLLVVGALPETMRVGFAVGVVSAFLTAVFTVLNKRFATGADPLAVTAIEMTSGWLFLWALLPALAWLPGGEVTLSLPDARDAILLVVLALFCTIVPFALSLVALRQVSAFSLQLAVNLEPIYAIGLAMLLLGEHRELTPAFYLGVAIVLAAVFLEPVLARRGKRT
jgi:drug/metabolite transporter (DMT)-like permease